MSCFIHFYFAILYKQGITTHINNNHNVYIDSTIVKSASK